MKETKVTTSISSILRDTPEDRKISISTLRDDLTRMISKEVYDPEKFDEKDVENAINAMRSITKLYNMIGMYTEESIDEVITYYFKAVKMHDDRIMNSDYMQRIIAIRDRYINLLKDMAKITKKDARHERAEILNDFLGKDNIFTMLLYGSVIREELNLIGNVALYSSFNTLKIRAAFPIEMFTKKKTGSDLAIFEVTLWFDDKCESVTVDTVDIIGIDKNYDKVCGNFDTSNASTLSHLSVVNPNNPAVTIHTVPYLFC